MLPADAEVHIVGKGGQQSPRYTGNKKQKLQSIARDLNTRLNEEVRLPATDTGDAGMDLLAWLPVGDTANGLLVYFGQC